MDLNPTVMLAFLQNQGYFIVFLLMFAERALVTYVAAFSASLGFFNIYYIAFLSILGVILADPVFYLVGKLANKFFIKKYIGKVLSGPRVKKIEHYLKNHPWKTLIVIKLVPPPLPLPGIILSGVVGVPFKKFFLYTSIINIIYFSFISMAGFYSGVAFKIISKYIEYSSILFGLALLLIFLFWKLIQFVINMLSRKIEKI
jgi:membrane protein DedA with SNARE-associated domain